MPGYRNFFLGSEIFPRTNAKKYPFIMQEAFAGMTLYNSTSLLRPYVGFTQPKDKYSCCVNAALPPVLHGSSCLVLCLRKG